MSQPGSRHFYMCQPSFSDFRRHPTRPKTILARTHPEPPTWARRDDALPPNTGTPSCRHLFILLSFKCTNLPLSLETGIQLLQKWGPRLPTPAHIAQPAPLFFLSCSWLWFSWFSWLCWATQTRQRPQPLPPIGAGRLLSDGIGATSTGSH